MYKDRDRELEFPHAVCVSYQNGNRGKNGEVIRGWIRTYLSADLGWQYTWETNGVGLSPGYGPTAV